MAAGATKIWIIAIGIAVAFGAWSLTRTPVTTPPHCDFHGNFSRCYSPQLQNPWAFFALPLFFFAGLVILLGFEVGGKPSWAKRRVPRKPTPPPPGGRP